MKGDGEPALVQVQREIVDKRSAGSVPQNPPAYDPQANGAVERGVQEFMNQMRAMKIGQEQRIQFVGRLPNGWSSWPQRSSTGALLDTTERRCMRG